MVLPKDSEIEPRQYKGMVLGENFGSEHPIIRFQEWFSHAKKNNTVEPDAFTLSTSDGKSVNSRTIALLGLSGRGFLIYTNYHSSKAKEMDEHPQVSMTFYFAEVFRQIRVKGMAERVSEEQSDEYFRSRPRGSQVGAWVSRQSEHLSSRDELNEAYSHFESELAEVVPRPSFWGGYEIVPYEFEFMQGHENRLHDRFRFLKGADTNFRCERLWP